MPVRQLEPEDAAAFTRGTPVVCIQAVQTNAEDSPTASLIATTLSVLDHTDPSTTVLVVGTPQSTEPLREALPRYHGSKEVLWLPLESDTSPARALNVTLDATFPGDVIVVAPGAEVAGRWCELLADAATSDSTVASATPLALMDGTLASSLRTANDLVEGEADELADRLSKRTLRLRPRTSTIGHECAYIRRPAVELVGPLDEALPVQDAVADFALRAVAAGMVHVAADDVLVRGPTGQPERPQPSSPTGREQQIQETIVNDEHGRLHRAVTVARTAVGPLSVTIDGRALVDAVGGTQTYILDLVLALARERDIRLRVLVPPDLSRRAANALERLPAVEVMTYQQALERPGMTDVVHRPQPIFTADDLTLLRLVGERVVVGQQDLIAYHNHAYHRDVEAWRSYRRTTRLALAAADQVVFFSEHAREDALSEDLLPRARANVVGVGAEALEDSIEPSAMDLVEERPFLLCLGADYMHKNRPFAIRLLDALGRHGWDGTLVMAGPHVPFGSSRDREQELLSGRPDLAARVVDLGPVDEAAKLGLFEGASALTYPTLYEGLGLLPLEAARAGLPCLFAAQASLGELAGAAATLVPWDPSASAHAVLPLLTDEAARADHLSKLRSITTPTWAEVAGQLIAVYRQAVRSPPSEAAPRSWQELDREAYVEWLENEVEHLRGVAQEYQDAYHEFERRVSSGLPLVDEGGLLTPAQQRGLMRLAGRRGLGAIVLAPLGLLGRGRSRGKDGQLAPPG